MKNEKIRKCLHCKAPTKSHYHRYCDMECRLLYNSVSVGDCRIWIASTDEVGRPTIAEKGTTKKPGRIMFEQYNRPLKPREWLYQTCDDKTCIDHKHQTTEDIFPVFDLYPKIKKEIEIILSNQILIYSEISEIFDVPVHHLKRMSIRMGIRRR